jgi:hypothetical protein
MRRPARQHVMQFADEAPRYGRRTTRYRRLGINVGAIIIVIFIIFVIVIIGAKVAMVGASIGGDLGMVFDHWGATPHPAGDRDQ